MSRFRPIAEEAFGLDPRSSDRVRAGSCGQARGHASLAWHPRATLTSGPSFGGSYLICVMRCCTAFGHVFVLFSTCLSHPGSAFLIPDVSAALARQSRSSGPHFRLRLECQWLLQVV
eukprot:6749338-Pyramimonas_sp.AAC.2